MQYTIDDAHRIDIHKLIGLHREGRRTLALGTGWLRFEIDPGFSRLTLSSATERVNVWLIERNAGSGKRLCMICPACGSVRHRLLATGRRVGCRTCLGLKYYGQVASRRQRRREMVWKLKQRLDPLVFPFEPIPERPVGMRKKQYGGLVRRMLIRAESANGREE